MKIYSISGSGLISGGSLTGTHSIEFYETYVIVEDYGGIFSSQKKSIINYNDVELYITIANYGLSSSLKLISDLHRIDVNITNIELISIYEIISKSRAHKFYFIDDSVNTKKINVMLKTLDGFSFGEITFQDNEVYITDFVDTYRFHMKEIAVLDSISDNHYIMKTREKVYEIIADEEAKIHLKKLENVYRKLRKFENLENLIEIETDRENYLAYKNGTMLEFYTMDEDRPVYNLPISDIKIFLGKSKLVIKCAQIIITCKNIIAKELCEKLSIVPYRLYELLGSNYMSKNQSQFKLGDLLCWTEENKFYFYNVDTNELIKYEKDLVKRSAQNDHVIVLSDSLINTAQELDFLESVETPEILFSEDGFPLFFKRESTRIFLSVPNYTIYEDTVKNFYEKPTQQIEDNVKISNLDGKDIVMPIRTYKSLFKETLYETRLPVVPNTSTETLLASRARNLSDLLLFEFFGQWQIIVDFVQSEMKKDNFSEEEITQYGLYLYHATFQQRKRMEELASKFPQFMYVLSKQLTINPKLNLIYQRQQKEMFHLAGQLKSHFIEIENLLSQITYIHSNYDEYEKRIKEAESVAFKKKLGSAFAAGAIITIATGGLAGLILPAFTLMSEWSNSEKRKVLDEIQREKEYKRNEFLFKKAIDLIEHMNKNTLRYYIQMLNQLTYRNLRAETKEIALGNSEEFKTKLLRQSLDIYSKLSLPIDYNNNLKPDKLLESILAFPDEEEEKIVTLFLE